MKKAPHPVIAIVRRMASVTRRAPKTKDQSRQELAQALREGLDLITLLRTNSAIYFVRTRKLILFHDGYQLAEMRTREYCQEWLDKLAEHNVPVTLIPAPKPAKAT